MGCYMNGFTASPFDKANILIRDYGAVVVSPPRYIDPDSGNCLVCVIQNVNFDAAGVVYCEREFKDMLDGLMGRLAWWLSIDRVIVEKFAPHLPEWIESAKRAGSTAR